MGEHEKIVIVEDDPEHLRLLKKALEPDDHEIVWEADTFESACTRLTEGHNFTLAIIDGSFPHETGWEPELLGEIFAERVRIKKPLSKVVAHSSGRQNWGDLFLDKNFLSFPEKIRQRIREL